MRDYGQVWTKFWNNPDIRSLSDDGRLAALYLLTGPQSNTIGAFLCPDSQVADALQWPTKRVAKALAELFGIGFAKRFRDGRHIVIVNYLKWNPIQNPNVGKSAIKQAQSLPADPASSHIIKGLEPYRDKLGNGFEILREQFAEPLAERLQEPLGQPFRNPDPIPEPFPEPEPEPDHNNIPLRGTVMAADGFDDWWERYPLKVEKVAAKKAYDGVLKKNLATAEQLLAGIEHYAAACRGKEARFIKHPATWLNKGCWLDEGPQDIDRPRSGPASAVAGIDAG